MSFYDINLQALEKYYPNLYNRVKDIVVDTEKYQVIATKSNNSTLKVSSWNINKKIETYLHSKYDPIKEAVNYAKAQLNHMKANNFIYGFGLGYHIQELIKIISNDINLYIVDLNIEIFKMALELNDLSHVIRDKRVQLIIDDNENILALKMKEIFQKCKWNDDIVNLLIYTPAIKTIDENNSRFKQLIEDWNIKKSAEGKWDEIVKNNREQAVTIEAQNIGVLFNQNRQLPVIIVSSGPSLNENKHILKEIKGKAFIISAGSALKALLEIGVEPDLICLIDPQAVTYAQISGYENIDIPLVYYASANIFTVSAYEGPKYIATDDKNNINNKQHLVRVGSSVANLMLDIAIKIGGNPITFVGQDLAFVNNQHHVKGNMYGGEEKVESLPNMRKTEGQKGEILDTTLGYMSMKNWIEARIEENPNTTFINSSQGGAKIKGCKNMSLINVCEQINNNRLESKNKIDEFIKLVREKSTYSKKQQLKTISFNIKINNKKQNNIEDILI